MNADLQTALSVFLIGMLTVFVVLTLVIYTGKLVIWMVNRTVSREEARHLADHHRREAQLGEAQHHHLPAIIAAVDTITQGKGRIESIEWIEQ
ncbi:OadG family protein [Flavilitoribacter nigricans]|uniref:Oxaloacetate decarboxylase n=1 Tax=Flavilitoribacter nigricans (strain ATCC 23147 / DSM 23189 / NBRC 102662 / NCIMB 1420 / SS-2) TaxID=1122177 RepID=A0A2D0NHT3_FLAN2|nr:OadG family protein [Flavilitoribacter nigricans]PHN07729.1 oxaloacetate decarboxylase [Flavilitoribacter nigricans DSM 23189 = NBRC 102662]